MDILLKIGLALIIGIAGGKLAKLVKLPSVSGYLIAGLFVGPSLFGLMGFPSLMTKEELTSLDFISEIALAFIAFSIGSEFSISAMKQYGKKVVIITIAEVIGAVGLVFSVMYFIFSQPFELSITIAAMSAATAPAATLLVMKQYRAHGPMTKTLLSVVAFDDVVGIIIFGIALPLAKMRINAQLPNATPISTGMMIASPFIEIFGSILIGFIIGVILSFVAKREKDKDDLQVISLIAVLVGVGIPKLFEQIHITLSPLLINIMIGMTIVNLMKKPQKTFESVNNLTAPFYVLFFTFAGAKLDLKVLSTVGLMGVAYIFSRGLGKYAGAWVGGTLSKADKPTTNFLGLGLLPQGGISIGLSLIVAQVFFVGSTDPNIPSAIMLMGEKIITVIMASVLIYETTGPIFSKLSISLAGEINGLDKFELDHPDLEIQ